MTGSEACRRAVNELSESEVRLLCWYVIETLTQVVSAISPQTQLVVFSAHSEIPQEVLDEGAALSIQLKIRTSEILQEAN